LTTCWCTIVVLVALPTQNGAESAPPKEPVQRLSLFDGFENGRIADFWRKGDYGEGRYAPGAVVVSKDHARSGESCVRITVRQGDIDQAGDGGTRTERAELDSGKHPLLGRDAWYGFSFLVPPDFPVVDIRLVLAQWKQGGLRGGPLVAQRYRAGVHYLTIRTTAVGRADRKYALPKLTHGRWNDMIYHIRFSRGADGLVEVWMAGTKVVTHHGPTAFESGEPTIYNKFGLYRDRWEVPMTLYFDNYAAGEGRAAVDPARLDAKSHFQKEDRRTTRR
jgi:hypothetical protein